MAVQSQDHAQSQQQGKVVPGPKGYPVVGPLLSLKRDVLGTMHRAMLTYGDVVRFEGGPRGKYHACAYIVFHPEMIQHVLATGADTYEKGETFDEVRAVLGEGLLTSEGETWKRQKRLVQPLFTHRRVAAYVPMMVDEGEGVIGRWRPYVENGGTVDLHSEMTRITLRIVGRAVFGTEVDHMLPIFKDRVPYLSQRAFQRAVNPMRIPPTWPTPGNRRAAAAKATIYGVVDDLIARRRREPTQGEDLVSLLLQAQDPEGGVGLDDDEVRDQALIFLMAGHETTATSLTFTLHLLGHHPEMQRRVQDEIDAILGDRAPTLEDVPALEYTTMAVKEAMRLYPAAYSIPRVSKQDYTVDGYTVPAGYPTIVGTWATHRHPALWEDPDRFEPERFTPEREKARHRYAYLPFGGGPRACIGSYFSMLESVIVVATLLRAYGITTEHREVPLSTGITLRPAQAMPAQLIAR
jgi:cytochrome P450